MSLTPLDSSPSASTPSAPRFSTLDRNECLMLLTRHDLGRIAFSLHDRVDIEPINYFFNDGWLYGRTTEGAKLETTAHNRWVAFEVDEVRGRFDWASVVVHGTFMRLDLDSPVKDERISAALAAGLLDNVVPNTLAVGDPVPWRTVLFRIHLDEVTGRRAVPTS